MSREQPARDPLYGVGYIRLRDRHQQVTPPREFVTKGRDVRCTTCGTPWPCEVGQALASIEMLPRS